MDGFDPTAVLESTTTTKLLVATSYSSRNDKCCVLHVSNSCRSGRGIYLSMSQVNSAHHDSIQIGRTSHNRGQ